MSNITFIMIFYIIPVILLFYFIAWEVFEDGLSITGLITYICILIVPLFNMLILVFFLDKQLKENDFLNKKFIKPKHDRVKDKLK